MKRLLSLSAIVMYIAIAVQAQTPADKERALKYLESTKQGVLDSTAGLSEAQWNFKSAPDRWSIAEVAEHIAAAEDLLRGMIVDKVMATPVQPEGPNSKATDDAVLSMAPDRSHKLQAPEPLKPTNRFGSPQGSLKHFIESRQQTIDFLKQHDDLRLHAMEGPMGSKLDAYQWILLIAGHSERHTKQINEVKADPNFPKK
jgi:hypothetical protein